MDNFWKNLVRFSINQKINEGMELIPISTTQNNQGDCKLFLVEMMLLQWKFNPPHVTFTGESNCSLVLYVNVKAWWRQTSWELYVCSPRKKSVNLKSSLLDRLLTTNVEHTYMYLINNIYIYIHIYIYIYVYNYLKTSAV